MNKNIKQLYKIASKDERTIIGLMSGTSMDGLDIALCKISNAGMDTKIDLLKFTTASYTDEFRSQLKSIFSRRDADLQTVCLMNEVVGRTHAELINSTLKSWGIESLEVDLIASHGQTIFHAPASLHEISGMPNATLQIGDGDHIAVGTGIITLSDFRQKHIAAGGEGAPLAAYGDILMFSKKGEERVLLNIGGISNFTYLPADGDLSKVFSTDIGPGNTLMDQFVQAHFSVFYDKDAKIAYSGTVNQPLLGALLTHDFFQQGFPKTTGPELFNVSYLENAQRESQSLQIPKEDVMATLCAFSARSIIDALRRCCSASHNPYIYMSGGGIHNPLMIQILKESLPDYVFLTTDSLNIAPDAKEAILFALLANEAVAGGSIQMIGNKAIPNVSLGKVSFPN